MHNNFSYLALSIKWYIQYQSFCIDTNIVLKNLIVTQPYSALFAQAYLSENLGSLRYKVYNNTKHTRTLYYTYLALYQDGQDFVSGYISSPVLTDTRCWSVPTQRSGSPSAGGPPHILLNFHLKRFFQSIPNCMLLKSGRISIKLNTNYMLQIQVCLNKRWQRHLVWFLSISLVIHGYVYT